MAQNNDPPDTGSIFDPELLEERATIDELAERIDAIYGEWEHHKDIADEREKRARDRHEIRKWSIQIIIAIAALLTFILLGTTTYLLTELGKVETKLVRDGERLSSLEERLSSRSLNRDIDMHIRRYFWHPSLNQDSP